MLTSFRTHTGEIVTGERLQNAINIVADDYKQLAYAIRKENTYAEHVTEEAKESRLQNMLEKAERIRSGEEKMSFWLWQTINTQLTGECIAFLSK